MSASTSAKERYLETLDHEHAITVKLLSAYPEDRLDLRPHPRSRTARELAWAFVMERGLGVMVFNDEFPERMSDDIPEPPESLDDVLEALRQANAEFRELVASTPDEEMDRRVRFYTGPGRLSEIGRMDLLWFLLHDEIHHRGQFSVYLRMADGKVPAIYGPSADEPWT